MPRPRTQRATHGPFRHAIGVSAAGAAEVSTLPFAGAPPADGSAQAVAIAPTPQAANTAADPVAPPVAPVDTQNLFLWITVVVLALPLLLVMTLLATVLNEALTPNP